MALKDKKKDRERLLFFRGHSCINYLLIPSVMRMDEDLLEYSTLKNERDLYNEIQYRCPADFAMCRSHLEKLSIMQHYGIPTVSAQYKGWLT